MCVLELQRMSHLRDKNKTLDLDSRLRAIYVTHRPCGVDPGPMCSSFIHMSLLMRLSTPAYSKDFLIIYS